MKVYTAALLGYGGMAGHHERILRAEYDRMNLKGIFDINSKRCDVAREEGYYVYSSKEELINDPEVDVVIIATTNEVHKSLAIEAMRAGKHVVCEKPVTLSSAELQEIIDVQKETGCVFTIDQNRRTNRDFVLMKRKVEEGLIGKPYVIESRVEGSRGMPSGWRTLKELGGGMMLDWGVHLIDQLMYMFPEKIKEVNCQMFHIQYDEVDDNFRMDMTFESGLIAHIEVSTNNFITHPRWYVLGTDGTMQINDWNCDGEIVRVIDKENEWEEKIFYTAAGPTKTMAPRSENSTEKIKLSMPEDVLDDLQIVYDQFLDAVEGKAELTIKPEQAMRVMKVMEAAFESAEKHQIIKTDI